MRKDWEVWDPQMLCLRCHKKTVEKILIKNGVKSGETLKELQLATLTDLPSHSSGSPTASGFKNGFLCSKGGRVWFLNPSSLLQRVAYPKISQA